MQGYAVLPAEGPLAAALGPLSALFFLLIYYLAKKPEIDQKRQYRRRYSTAIHTCQSRFQRS